jgi:hypothetical protein
LGPSRTPVGVRLGKVKPFFLDTQGKLHQWGDTTKAGKREATALQSSFS